MTLLSLSFDKFWLKQKLKICNRNRYYICPFEYQDTNGEYVGIDIELMKSIAEAGRLEVELKPLGFNAVQRLEFGQVDAVMIWNYMDERKQKNSTSQIVTYDSGIGMGVPKLLKSPSLSI